MTRGNLRFCSVAQIARGALAEDKDEFVFTAIEAAHPAGRLVPPAKVDQLAECRLGSGEQFPHVPPVHADIGKGAISVVLGKQLQAIAHKRHEFRRGHFPHGHEEMLVLILSLAPGMALDRHVVGWVGKDHARQLFAYHLAEQRRIAHIPACEAMGAKSPTIAKLHDCLLLGRYGRLEGQGLLRKLPGIAH